MRMLRAAKGRKYEWYLQIQDTKTNEITVLHDLKLITSLSISSNFQKVDDVLKGMSESLGEPFVSEFVETFNTYVSKGCDANYLFSKASEFVRWSKEYLDHLNIDYNQFSNEKKRSKTSIVFESTDIRKLMLASIAFKLYSIFSADTQLKLDENTNREFKIEIVKYSGISDILSRIYSVIKSRTSRSSVLDKYVWSLIKVSLNVTPEDYALEIFNFFCNNLFPLLDIKSNPISYLVKVTDDSINWIVCSRYKDKIIFSPESFSNIDEVFTSTLSKEIIELLCDNDLLKKVGEQGLNILERITGAKYGTSKFQLLQDKLDNIIQVPTAVQVVLLPIINKTLNVSFKYLAKTSPRILTLVGIAISEASKDTLGINYPILHNYLTAYSKTVLNNRGYSSYKVKNTDRIVNSSEKIFGLSSSLFKFEIISSICGLLLSSRKKLLSVIDDQKLPKFSNVELEDQVISFYTSLYNNNLEKLFENIRNNLVIE